MTLRDRTKLLLAQTLGELLQTVPMEKIRVTEICRHAQVQNQVFYYHFRDKYDLAAWVFVFDFSNSFVKSPVERPVSPQDHIGLMADQFGRMWKKRGLYRRLLSDKSQNCLERYIHEFDVACNEAVLKAYLGIDELDQELRYLAAATSYACLGLTIDWITGAFCATPLEMAQLQYNYMPDVLLKAHQHADAPLLVPHV